MAIRVEHEIHSRRWGRNLGLGVVLGAFVAIVFALTVVKVTALGPAAFGSDAMAVPGVGGTSVAAPAALPSAGEEG